MPNFNINSLILSNSWEIEYEFSLKELSNYFNNLELLNSKALSIKDLHRSNNTFVSLINLEALKDGEVIQTDYNDIRNLLNDLNKNESIVRMYLNGTMLFDSGWCNYGMKDFAEELLNLTSNPNAKGLFLEVNSGGGISQAGEIVMNAVKDAPVPVVSYVYMAASAAYRAILYSDRIIAFGEGAKLGSIGTYTTVNKKFLEMYKELYTDIYDVESTDKNKEFRLLLDNNLDGVQESVNKNGQLFRNAVEKVRNLPAATKESTLKGGLYNASEAIERGLADNMLSFVEALAELSSIIEENKNNYSNTKFVTMSFLNRNKKPEVVETTETNFVSLESFAEFQNSVQTDLQELENSITENFTAYENFKTSISQQVATLQQSFENLQQAVESTTENSAEETGKGLEDLQNKISDLSKMLSNFQMEKVHQKQTKETDKIPGALAGEKGKEKGEVETDFMNDFMNTNTLFPNN